jgi:hypothetical protein
LDAGALKAMLALALPALAEPMVGAPGTVTEELLLLPPPQATKLKVHTAAHKLRWRKNSIRISVPPLGLIDQNKIILNFIKKTALRYLNM